MSLKRTAACLGFEQITGLNTVKGLNPPANATLALIQAEAQVVRWRDDGTDPTAAIGMTLAAAAVPLVYDGNLKTIKFIEATATAKLNVSYYC